ncbi:MFS transporter [Actinoplanes auranticolor]|uniref:MFS transporter n=1 Tax=Actinoplanes auranticolor TaxID=47988 RepID=UPI001BB45E3E|nr:MFS transporter [Actinoplanes auranticolor]
MAETFAPSRAPSLAGPPSLRVAIGGGAAFFLIGLLVAVYGPLIPVLRASFGGSATAAGLLVSAHFAGSVLGVLAAGAAGRSTSRTRFLVALAFVAAGAVVLAAAPSWPVLLGGAFLLGLGFGGLDLDLNVYFASAYGERGAVVLNLLSAAFGVGAVAGPLLVAATDGNRLVIGLTYLVIALGTMPLLAGARSLPPAGPARGRGTVVGRPLIVAAFLVLFLLYVGAETGVASWAATYLIEVVGTGADTAAGATAAFWVAFTVGRLLAAPLSLRLPPARLVPLTLLLAAVSMALAWWPPAAGYSFVLTGLFLAPVFPTALSWFVQATPAAGPSTALVIAGASFGPILISPLIGLTHDRLGPAAIAPALAAVIILDLGLAVALRRPR